MALFQYGNHLRRDIGPKAERTALESAPPFSPERMIGFSGFQQTPRRPRPPEGRSFRRDPIPNVQLCIGITANFVKAAGGLDLVPIKGIMETCIACAAAASSINGGIGSTCADGMVATG